MKTKNILYIVFFFSSLHVFSQDFDYQPFPYQPAGKYLNQIIVEKSNVNFRNGKKFNQKTKIKKISYWDKFPANIHMFDSISREKHEDNWILFRDKIIELSKNKNLDYVSLTKCLELIKGDDNKIELLPIAAYQCKNRNHKVWVIICKWEYYQVKDPEFEYGGYGHIRIYAIDVTNFKIIAFNTCG